MQVYANLFFEQVSASSSLCVGVSIVLSKKWGIYLYNKCINALSILYYLSVNFYSLTLAGVGDRRKGISVVLLFNSEHNSSINSPALSRSLLLYSLR